MHTHIDKEDFEILRNSHLMIIRKSTNPNHKNKPLSKQISPHQTNKTTKFKGFSETLKPEPHTKRYSLDRSYKRASEKKTIKQRQVRSILFTSLTNRIQRSLLQQSALQKSIQTMTPKEEPKLNYWNDIYFSQIHRQTTKSRNISPTHHKQNPMRNNLNLQKAMKISQYHPFPKSTQLSQNKQANTKCRCHHKSEEINKQILSVRKNINQSPQKQCTGRLPVTLNDSKKVINPEVVPIGLIRNRVSPRNIYVRQSLTKKKVSINSFEQNWAISSWGPGSQSEILKLQENLEKDYL